MSEEAQRPVPTDPDELHDFWEQRGMPWRIEPEISEERRRYLVQRLAVKPDIENGIYPFRDENNTVKLSRADIEWLISYHREHVHTSIFPFKASLLELTGLDVRGADLDGTDLSGLPLTGLRGGLTARELADVAPERQRQARDMAAVHLEHATLIQANLEAATLTGAHLRTASCFGVHLEGATLTYADLHGASLFSAHLEGATLICARLEGVFARNAYLEGSALNEAHVEEARLDQAHLEGAQLSGAHLERAHLWEAHLEGAVLSNAHLEGAALNGASFTGIRPADKDLQRIRKWLPNFRNGLPPADLRGAFFDEVTNLQLAKLGDNAFGAVALADAHLNGVNLAVVDWKAIKVLGDERAARGMDRNHEYVAQPGIRLDIYQKGVRANRQMAIALRSQGLNEEADHFGYRAQDLQRAVLRQQKRVVSWLFSLFLWVVSGYGYRLRNIVATYGGVLLVFTIIYALMGVHSFPSHSRPPESALQALWDSFLVSLSAIHGRTTFEQLGAWTGPAWVAAVESVVGIVVEGVFVAMLVQRFFAR